MSGQIVQAVPALLCPEGQKLAFADPGRAEQGKIVAAPLLGNADAGLADPDDVVAVAISLLDLYRREDERPFLVDIACGDRIGGGCALPQSA